MSLGASTKDFLNAGIVKAEGALAHEFDAEPTQYVSSGGFAITPVVR